MPQSEINPVGLFEFGLLASRIVRKFLLFKPLSLWYFYIVALLLLVSSFQTPDLSLSPFLFGNHKFVFCV